MDFCRKYVIFVLTQEGDLKIIQFKIDSFNIYELQSFQFLSCLAGQLCAP